MSDNLIRTTVEENDKTIIKKQVMNKSDDKLIRHQVIGIGGSEPVLESITITENGNTTPPTGIDGYNDITVLVPTPTLESITITENGTTSSPSGVAYNEVVVNVPTPEPFVEKTLFSRYDLTAERETGTGNVTWCKDLVRYGQWLDDNNHYNVTWTVGTGCYFDNANSVLRWGVGCLPGYITEIEIDVEWDTTDTTTNNRLFNSSLFGSIYYEGGQWRVNGSSGTTYTGYTEKSDIIQNGTIKLKYWQQEGATLNQNYSMGILLGDTYYYNGGRWGTDYLELGGSNGMKGLIVKEIRSYLTKIRPSNRSEESEV